MYAKRAISNHEVCLMVKPYACFQFCKRTDTVKGKHSVLQRTYMIINTTRIAVTTTSCTTRNRKSEEKWTNNNVKGIIQQT